MRGGGAGQLACRLTGMPENQAAALFAIESLGQKTSCHEHFLDTGLSLETSREVENRVPWAYDGIKQLPGSVEAQYVFQEERRGDRLTLQAQTHLSTEAGGLGLPPAGARRMSTANGVRRVEVLPEVLADLVYRPAGSPQEEWTP